jgi:hypothetical protein
MSLGVAALVASELRGSEAMGASAATPLRLCRGRRRLARSSAPPSASASLFLSHPSFSPKTHHKFTSASVALFSAAPEPERPTTKRRGEESVSLSLFFSSRLCRKPYACFSRRTGGSPAHPLPPSRGRSNPRRAAPAPGLCKHTNAPKRERKRKRGSEKRKRGERSLRRRRAQQLG